LFRQADLVERAARNIGTSVFALAEDPDGSS